MSGSIGIQSGQNTFWWPAIGFAADLIYTYDVGPQYLNPVSDSIAALSLAIMPSGSGELQATDLTAIGNVISVQFASGVPGRTYTIQIQITGVSGRVWNIFGYLLVQIVAPGGWPPVPAPSPGYGTAITWTGSSV